MKTYNYIKIKHKNQLLDIIHINFENFAIINIKYKNYLLKNYNYIQIKKSFSISKKKFAIVNIEYAIYIIQSI